MKYLVMLLFILVTVFTVLFLGGLASAAWEVRQERRAGLPVSRPADELRAKRRARGDGLFGGVRIWWRGVRTGIPQCWCGRGSLLEYPGLGTVGHSWEAEDGYGCMAAENGDVFAWQIHEAAGGYARSASPVVGVRTPVRHGD